MFERLWRGKNPQSPEHDDRRAHPRHPINLETTCQLINESGAPSSVRVRDISRGGMKFLSPMKIDPGTLVRISLPPQSGAEAAVLACVMHCTPQTDGAFAVGCAFSDELGDDESRQFGGRKQISKGGTDKRAWMRFSAQGTAEYIVLPPTGAAAKKAEIANISATGIGLFVEENIEPGVMLDLLLRTKAGEVALDILACVVYLGRRSEGGWVAGCHFIRELGDADLKQLV